MKSQPIQKPQEVVVIDAAEIQRFVEERLETRRRNSLLPWSEDPLFKDFPLYEGPVPADLVERHDDYLAEGDD